MSFHDLLYASDLIGCLAFAISGALVAVEKKMDIFGVIILATVTATGGGTLRSLLISNPPPIHFKRYKLFVSFSNGRTFGFLF